MAKYKAKEEETPLLFFVAGEVGRGLFLVTATRDLFGVPRKNHY